MNKLISEMQVSLDGYMAGPNGNMNWMVWNWRPDWESLTAEKFNTIKMIIMKESITLNIDIWSTIDKVWKAWNTPEDIRNWNNFNDDWHTPMVQNDLRPGGMFLFAMGTKDGRLNFDFTGTYDEVKEHELISYTLDGGRKAIIRFKKSSPVTITETFEPDVEPSIDEQREFCQAILRSFKNYVESGNTHIS